jgi:hypothetical protein
MVGPAAATPVIIEVESAAEDSPLLGESHSQHRTRRGSSVIGDADNGYHIVPATLPGAPITQPEHDFWQVFGILSVLLIGKSA